jgi:hypothetical protein
VVPGERGPRIPGLGDDAGHAKSVLSEQGLSLRRTVSVLHRLLGVHVERYRYPRALALLKKVDGGARAHRAASDSKPGPDKVQN